jgi:hypothetical protein
MGRNIAAVVLGYLVIFVLLFCALTLAYLVLGADRAFRPATYEPSKRWILLSVVAGFVAAYIGGVVSAVIAKGSKAPLVLAALVLVLGILFAIPVLTRHYSTAELIRDGNVGFVEAMQNAKQAPWVALLNPLIGAVGVLAGSRFRRNKGI